MFGWLRKWQGGGHKAAPPPRPQGPLPEAALKHALERSCAPITFSKPANIDPLATMFGVVRVAGKQEVWPACGGVPLWPLLQINLTQAPLVPAALKDLSLIAVYISPDHLGAARPSLIVNTADPDPAATWALRSFATLEGLRVPRVPKHDSTLVPQMGEWGSLCPDYPNHDMAGEVVDTMANDIYAHDWCRTVAMTKLGGWPGTVQSEPWWDHRKTGDTWDFVLQIENEPKAGWYGWGDGAAYIARSRERPHLWALDVQFT
jgi:hypothetical protein